MIVSEQKSYLKYILNNCIFAFDELCRVHKRLIESWKNDDDKELQHCGDMNRIIQDYLIIRTAGLFDKTKHMKKNGIDSVVSFEKFFASDPRYIAIKKQSIIEYIIQLRHNFVGHNNIDEARDNWPETSKICSSDLKEVLQELGRLL